MNALHTGQIAPTGAVTMQKIPGNKMLVAGKEPGTVVEVEKILTAVPPKVLSLREIIYHGFPRAGLPDAINQWRARNIPNLMRGLTKVMLARALRVPHFYGQLSLAVIRGDGKVEDYGLASLRVVTTAGVNFIVDAFQNTTEVENLKFHGIGTGVAAEAVGDTALGTELTTQYNPDSTRATGTTTEGASANIYRTVGTNTLDSGTPAVTEHGVFSASSAGTLLDRSVFSAINLNGANGDGLQSTYDLTFTAGS